MFKRKSIFIKILYNNLLITLTPLIIVLFIICALICSNFKNSEIHSAQNIIDDYADKVKSEIMLTMQITTHILEYNPLVDNLNRTHETVMEKMEFNNTLTSYMDSITGTLPHPDSITVYFADSDVYENKYLQKVSRLKNAEEIKSRFSDTNIYWEGAVHTDDTDENKYFMLYRKMTLNKGCLLACRIYIPEMPSGLFADIIRQSEFTKNKKYVSAPINSEYIVTAPIDFIKINRMYLRYIFLFTLLGLCFSSALIWLTYKITLRVTTDIDSFIMRLDEHDILDFDINLEPASKEPRELRVIKKTIAVLMQRVKNVSDLQYQSELEKRKLELALLQSKIEPHVLYNSLSAIKLKAFQYNEQDTEISEIIRHLTCYYRAVLSRGKEYVRVCEEIDMLQHYVYINEISHGKSYRFEVDIPKEAENREILHLLLQPFVENAIIHGLSGKRKDCEIKISCRCSENKMKFTIYDNGYGLSSETLARLNDPDSSEGGYGIKNVRQRLRLEYGGQCSVRFTSEENVFTQAVIEFETK